MKVAPLMRSSAAAETFGLQRELPDFDKNRVGLLLAICCDLIVRNAAVTDGNTAPTSACRSDSSPAAGDGRPDGAELAPLLSDLRVLLLFVAVYQPRVLAGRPAMTDPRAVPAAADLASPRTQFSSVIQVPLLTKTPAEIATDPNLLDQLYKTVAILSQTAAPASAGSIQLTGAFTGIELGVSSPPEVAAFARRLSRWFVAMAGIGFAAFLLAIMLLIHTDQGRHAIRQLQELKLQYNQTVSSINDLNAGGAGAGGGAPCPNPGSPVRDRIAIARLQALCDELNDLSGRRQIIEQQLRGWNAVSDRLAYLTAMRWLGGARSLPAGLSEAEWTAAESRASAMMSTLTGVVLPMLLGLIGACAYVFRDLDQQIRTWTLHRGAAWHGMLRLLLGVMLGGLLSVFWNSGTTPRLDGVPLSLAALAFFVGFGVEIVFRTLDTVIAAVAEKISK
jgi:hypothetical protein